MTKPEFEAMLRREGYAPPRQVSFAPHARSELHQHDRASFVFVVEGEFILNSADGVLDLRAGETCILDKDIDHAEEAGPSGATILVARK